MQTYIKDMKHTKKLTICDNPKWNNLIEFTYVGNISDDFEFKNTKVIEPKSGKELSVFLKKYIYVTGSINEPSGNHHIEAADVVCRFCF